MNVTEVERKESTKHCCGNGCLRRDSAEHEEYAEALIDQRITENNNTNADRQANGLLEEIVSRENLNRAYKRVKMNKGAGGVDGMKVDELLQYLKDNGEEIRKSIVAGTYQPQPARRVEIPKDNGKKRKLGIPTAVDRVIQQAIAQVLTPIYEPKFAETSYGFRPKRSAHDALKKCKEYLEQGKVWTVDMDLEKFFDTVNQSKLMEILARDIKDGTLKRFVVGWVNYYKLASMANYLKNIDEWMRRRIRMVFWKKWKRVRTRCRNLRKLGIDHTHSLMTACCRRGYWYVAGGSVMQTALSSQRLEKAGFQVFSSYYRKSVAA